MTTPPDTATVTVTGDGDAVLDLRDGAPRQLHTGSLDAARKQAIAAVAAHARDTGQPVTVWARDPDAEHLLEVLPDGTVRPAPAPARSPFAPPEPAPEPAAEATAPAETDSEPVPAVVGTANSGGSFLSTRRVPPIFATLWRGFTTRAPAAFAQSIEEPPPNATIPSHLLSR